MSWRPGWSAMCTVCGRRVPAHWTRPTEHGRVCGDCADTPRPLTRRPARWLRERDRR